MLYRIVKGTHENHHRSRSGSSRKSPDQQDRHLQSGPLGGHDLFILLALLVIIVHYQDNLDVRMHASHDVPVYSLLFPGAEFLWQSYTFYTRA